MASLPYLQPPEVLRPQPPGDTPWSEYPYKWSLYLIYSLQKISGLGHQETLIGPRIPTDGLFTLSTASRSSPASASRRHSLVRASPQMASTTASQRSFASSRLALLNLKYHRKMEVHDNFANLKLQGRKKFYLSVPFF
jgi:hypothetical protein